MSIRLGAGPSLRGTFLVAMPGMPDDRFDRTVIYMCEHSPDGAMGIVVNKLFRHGSLGDLLEQLDIEPIAAVAGQPVHIGGPVEMERGFVLHSTDLIQDATLVIDQDVALTATLEILHALARGEGPAHALFALGYAGWGPGQLDQEIQANGWLNVPASPALLFDADIATKWERAIGQLGFDPAMLSAEAGRA